MSSKRTPYGWSSTVTSSRRQSEATPVPGHALVSGLGSIGRRHLRHLRAAGVGRIDAYRTGKATLPDDGQPPPDVVFHDLDEALAAGPELVVVANPTALHLPVALAALRAGCHVLVEKPLSHSLAGCDELAAAAEAAGVFAGVAYNLRFHPLLVRVHAMAASGEPLGRPLLARAHVGGYLPDWHPWEDYRRGYAARRDLGGGAALTNSHEIDEVQWLLGPARWAGGTSLPGGPLGTDVDEASVVCLRHGSGAVSTVSLSLVERPPARTLHLDFERGRVEVDLIGGELRILRPEGPAEVESVPEGYSFDETYAEQVRAVFRAMAGGPSTVATLADGVAVLRVIERIEGMEAG
ncbi:MAG TPA: Gfo/Idh/MocA family oxidoreductase [Acidobacteria bacterium]|nr:Gfo/Idh/MocA family oxidoreductase [Acidobacteriota bacterium]